jgi:hypothetical protein
MSKFFLRVPSFAAAAAHEDLPASVPCLPREAIQPGVWYGIRCHDSWLDVRALLSGEHGWVLLALRQCARAYFIPCATKDPLLLVMYSTTPQVNTNLLSVVTKLWNETSADISIAGLEELDPSFYFTYQQQLATATSELSPEDAAIWSTLQERLQDNKYKNYKTLRLTSDEVDADGIPKDLPSWATVFPRQALIDTSYRPQHTVTITASKDALAVDVAKAVGNTYGCIYLQSKGVLKVFTRAPTSAEDITFFLSCPGVLKVTQGAEVKWKPSNKPPRSDTHAEHREARVAKLKHVTVRRLDGNPIPEAAAQLILAALNFKSYLREDVALVVEIGDVETARRLHETRIGTTYVIAWCGDV